jgi:hypothetical protein
VKFFAVIFINKYSQFSEYHSSHGLPLKNETKLYQT